MPFYRAAERFWRTSHYYDDFRYTMIHIYALAAIDNNFDTRASLYCFYY